MEALLREFRRRCRESVLNLLWRQWCSLGVSGHAEGVDPRRLIDLEALVLATSSIGRRDPRLFDEALDWLGAFGTLMNLQRLANLQRAHRLGDARVIAAMADWLVKEASQPRWKAMAKQSGTGASKRESLFFETTTVPASALDPIFLGRGFERGIFRQRGMSRPPRPLQPPNLMASMRALIGVSARVEILLFLAGNPAAKASEIARATGYAPRTLQALLQEMLLSGHILSQEQHVRRKAAHARGAQSRYHLQPSDWAFLTSGKPLPVWTPWASLYALAEGVLDAIPELEVKVHPAVVSSRLREILVAEGPALAAGGLLPELDLPPGASGAELLETLAARLPALLDAF